MNEFQISDNKVDRKSCPHHATITMKIDIRKMYDDMQPIYKMRDNKSKN